MIAVGQPGRIDELPEKLREREQPSGRLELDALVVEGRFGGKPVAPSNHG